MRQIKIAVLGILMLTVAGCAHAMDWYISQNGSGTQDGTSAANSQSAGWLDTPGTWDPISGVISAGDTIHLCGVLISPVYVLADSVTVYFEAGSRISLPAGTCMFLQGRGGLTIDGGVGGVIENTANGTGLANQVAADGILASGCNNLTVRNLTIQNIYVHTNVADVSTQISSGGGVYMNGGGGMVTIQSCVFSNVGWCINFVANQSGMEVCSNVFINYDHGVAMGVSGLISADIFSNRFDTTANWDSTANAYHHDGIHYFGTAGISNFSIRDNLFCGFWGNNNTGHVYLESGPSNVVIYNNVFLQYPNNNLNDGELTAYGNFNQIFNNTFVGSGVANSGALTVGGQSTAVSNNIFTTVTTFISARNIGVTYGNNVYANQAYAGNAPFGLNTTAYASLAAWQAVMGDAGSILVNNAYLNADGSLMTNGTLSPAISVGVNLSAAGITNDIKGYLRRRAWDAGAFAAYGVVPPQILTPPPNVHVVTPAAPTVETTNYMINNVSLGSLRNNATVSAGRLFQVRSNITLTQIGRWVAPGNNQTHTLSVYSRSCVLLGSVTINTAGAPSGAFLYGTLPSPVPLTKGSTYSILSSEVSGGDSWYDNNTSFSLATGDTLPGCAEYLIGNTCTPSSSGSLTFGPIDAQYTKP